MATNSTMYTLSRGLNADYETAAQYLIAVKGLAVWGPLLHVENNTAVRGSLKSLVFRRATASP